MVIYANYKSIKLTKAELNIRRSLSVNGQNLAQNYFLPLDSPWQWKTSKEKYQKVKQNCLFLHILTYTDITLYIYIYLHTNKWTYPWKTATIWKMIWKIFYYDRSFCIVE